MSRIHFVGGEKGGVGKSVVARLLCQFCIDEKRPFAGIDADHSHGALRRYYSEASQSVDLTDFPSVDTIMDRALGAEREVIVDLPAQSARLLKAWMDSANVLEFCREMGVQLCFWHVTDGGYDSVRELERALSQLGEEVHYVVVKNAGRSPDFSQLEDSAELTQVQTLGGQVLELPALHSATMYKIDRLGTSFWAAVHSDDPSFSLSTMERQRTRLWLAECYSQFQTVFAAAPAAETAAAEPAPAAETAAAEPAPAETFAPVDTLY